MRNKIILFALIAFLGCRNIPNANNTNDIKKAIVSFAQNDTTILKCTLNAKETVSFFYTDEYGKTESPFFLSKKDSIKKLIIRYPTLLIDSYHHIPFLVYPGETITVSLDSGKLPQLLIVKNKIRNNELNFFVEQFKKRDFLMETSLFFKGSDKNRIVAKGFDYDNLLKNAKESYHKRKIFLDAYHKYLPISAQFIQYCNTLFKYLYCLQVLIPTRLVNIDISNLPKGYCNLIDSLLRNQFSCDSCTINYAYQLASTSLLGYLGRNFHNKSDKFSLIYDTTEKSFSGNTRRFLLFTHLKQNMEILPKNYNWYMNSFLSERKDNYSAYLLENIALVEKMNNSDNKELMDMNGNKIKWEDFLSKYANSVLYIDFWASWCVPCRKEIPDFLNLRNEFKGKKISFIYLSIDKDVNSWKRAVKEEAIDIQNSFLVLNNTKSSIIRRFKVNTIPHYLLIGKDGNIINSNAPWPSEKVTRGLINENL